MKCTLFLFRFHGLVHSALVTSAPEARPAVRSFGWPATAGSGVTLTQRPPAGQLQAYDRLLTDPAYRELACKLICEP